MKRAIPSVLLALVLAIAAQTLWGLAAVWAEEIRRSFGPREGKYESLQLLEDGTPVVTTQTYRAGFSKQSMRTLDGRVLPDSEELSVSTAALPLFPGRRERDRVLRLDWQNRIHGFFLEQFGPGESWYAVSEPDGSTKFVGFDMQSRRILGYLGRSGFRDTPPPLDDQFPLTPEFVRDSPESGGNSRRNLEPWRYSSGALRPLLLPLANEVVEIDVAKRKVATVWRGAGVVAAATLASIPTASKRKLRAVVRTGTRLHVLGVDYEEKYAVEIPEVFRHEMFYVTEFTAQGLTTLSGEPQTSVAYLAHLTADGPSEIQAVPLDNPKPDGRPAWPMVAMAMPQPTGLVAGLLVGSPERAASGKAPSWNEAIREEWPRFWPTLLVVAVASAVLAAAAVRRQRRFGLGYGYLWAPFVFVCGVPGWLAYRWHRAWPPLEACPHCGAMAPRDREACFRCGKDFPPPKRESIEIRD
jgi:hypothetical protein